MGLNLNLNVLGKLSDDVALGGVFTNKKLGRPEASGKDSTARLHGAPHLSGALPDDLGEMRCHRVAGVVLGNFISP